MEKVKYLFMTVLVALVSMSMVSCSDDEEGSLSSNPLVGTWVERFEGQNKITITTFVFKKDGTGVFSIRQETASGSGVTADPQSFSYAYDEVSKLLKIKFDNSYIMHTATAVITGGNMVLEFPEDDSEFAIYYQLKKQ